MDAVMSNIAHASTTRTPDGGPYRRKEVVFSEMLESQGGNAESGLGVQVTEMVQSQDPFVRVHQPGHPDADADGYVLYPNVKPAEEMVDLMASSRSYEANVTAFRIAREMFQRSLEMGRA